MPFSPAFVTCAYLNERPQIDWALTKLLSSPVPLHRTKSLVLLASSHTLLSFQLRPFSNSIEAVLLALVSVSFKKVV
ncbi:hypothetical protein JAAARDRAFT_134408, partial [Jaapia argillacea MUCL 33604]